MKEFSETGLPADEKVFLAYTTYTENIKAVPRLAQDFPLRVAQTLSAAHVQTPETLALPMLALALPPGTWGVITRRFGDEMLDQVKEFHLHNNTGNAYLDEASANVKAMNVAAAITTLDDFATSFDALKNEIEKAKTEDSGDAFKLKLPLLPSLRTFNHVYDVTENQTGHPELEALYAERLASFLPVFEDYQATMKELGVQLPGMQTLQSNMADGMGGFRYPDFDAGTGLYDDPLVRAAYQELTTNPMVLPEDFEAAVLTGKVLSELDNPAPKTIAAGLLDVGLRTMNVHDMKFLEKRIDPDVIEILAAASINVIQNAKDVLESPPAMRQITMAFHTAELMDATQVARELSEAIDSGMLNMPPQALKANLMSFEDLGRVTMSVLRGVPGKTGAEDLDLRFVEALRGFNEVVAELGQKIAPRPAPKPAPKPKASGPQPKPSSGSFDL